MAKAPRTVDTDFTANEFTSAKDKRLTMNDVVSFLESGLDEAKFNKRVYHFFSQTLSMSASFDRYGFIAEHLSDKRRRARFLEDTRYRTRQYAMLDPQRNSDMAAMFDPDFDGRYAHLIGY